MDRAQKQELVKDLNAVFGSAGIVVVAHYSGLSVADMTSLRNKMRETGASFRVTKNRLTKLALEGTDKAALKDLFEGPTAMPALPKTGTGQGPERGLWKRRHCRGRPLQRLVRCGHDELAQQDA